MRGRAMAVRRVSTFLVAALVCLSALAAPAPETVEARITYISGSTIYLDAGLEQGLVEGAVVEVWRDGRAIALLRVGTVTARRSAASAEGSGTDLREGDLVRFVPAASPPPEAAPVAPTQPTRRPRNSGVRGRVGVRYMRVEDRTGLGGDFSQPALDLRVVGTQVGGAAFDFDADIRPRRTYTTRVDGSSDDWSSNRVYSMMGAWRPGPFRIALGRQMSPSLGPIALFDGLLAEYRNPRFATGIFAGTEPDPVDWGYDSTAKDIGAWAEGNSAPGAATRWWLNGGLISSTIEGEINRDLFYAAGRVSHGGLHAWLLQQVDVNRGWRKDAEDSSLTRTGSYVALSWQVNPTWSFNAGFDDRRDVRLYRDLVTPATQFDDTYRQGYWAGVDLRPGGHWLLGADARSSSGGIAGEADSMTLRLGLLDLTRQGVDVLLRGTHYTGPLVDGDLATLNVEFDLGSRLRLDLHGGGRDETENTLLEDSRQVNWFGLGLQLVAGRHGFATLAWDRTTGGDEDNDQLYASLSWRF